MHHVLYYYSISIFYYCKEIKERSKKSAWCPPPSQTFPQATSWYFSSLLAIDHRMTSFSWCFYLHAKKNKQPCLEVINYSKYLQYFEGQINKVFRPYVLDCWLHSGSKKVQWKHFLLFTDVFAINHWENNQYIFCYEFSKIL